MRLSIWLFIFGLVFSFHASAQNVYSPSEGALDRGHDPALNKYRRKYFYRDDGSLDPQKMEKLVRFLEYQKSVLMDSAKMNRKTNLILDHGYDNDAAEKEGLEAQSSEAETIAPLIFALEHIRDLQLRSQSMTALEIHNKVELILLFFGAGYTLYPMTIFTSAVERLKNVAENFFEFSTDEKAQVQASNLLLNGHFATQSELHAYRRREEDLSKLNPPSSPIWTNNDVRAYDPYAEVYWNKKFFPPREIALPVFQYERMGNGTIKLKSHWLDQNELNKKGLPKKKDVTLRVGIESYTASVVNHLARIIGYPANPTTFRPAILLKLGEVSFEEFLSQWKRIHGLGMGSAITHIERIPHENAVILKNVTLEAYPDKDDYRKMGPFRMGDNGLRNRREYRAMVLYNALISLQDEFEYQSRVDAIKDENLGWLPIFFISDTSSALGAPALGNVGTVNEFTWEFTKKDHGKIRLFWISFFNSRTWKDTTYSDVKWLARRMAQIRTEQIDGIMATSGFPEPAQKLFAEKLKSRLNKMMVDFELLSEGFSPHPVRTKADLAATYPQYVNEKGQLKEGSQEYPGNTLPLLGERFTLYQAGIVLAINALQNKFLSLFNPAKHGDIDFIVDLGHNTTDAGVGYEASRGVSVNPELGPGQRRYLLQDKLSLSIPVGFFYDNITLPAGLFYTYTFEYKHSVSTMREVGTKRFFSLLNPFSIGEIRRTLAMGEQLKVTHSIGASVGKVRVKTIEGSEVEAALLGLGRVSVKNVYFSLPHPNLFEIATDHLKVSTAYSGLDIRTYIRLAANMQTEKNKKTYRLYRIDTLNHEQSDEVKLQRAFDSVLIDNDFSPLEQIVTPHEWVETGKSKQFNFSFFFWDKAKRSGVSTVWVDNQKLILAHKVDNFDRSFNHLWNDKLDGGALESAINYFGNFWDEGKHIALSFEGVVDKSTNRFSEMEMTITLSMFDNYCTPREFEAEFKDFFNQRSGATHYIRFVMPEELSGYPELEGTMKWQISKKALRDILSANSVMTNKVGRKAYLLLRALDSPQNSDGQAYSPEMQAADLMYVMNELIGRKAQDISRLRRFTSDENIWITTNISNMLELSNPTFRHQKDNVFWAPEIGKYQGHSYLDRFRRNYLLEPVFN